MRKIPSLKTKLTLTIVTVVLITVAIISFFANFFINKQFVSYIKKQQELQTTQIVSTISQLYSGGSGASHGHMGGMIGRSQGSWDTSEINSIGNSSLSDGYLISLYDTSGKIIWDAQTVNSHGCKRIMSDISDRMSANNFFDDGEFLTTSYDISAGGNKVATLDISHYGPYFFSDNDFKFIDSLNIIIFSVATVALIASVIVGSYLASRLSKPILTTANLAGKIAEGDYNIRIDEPKSTREIHQLTGSFNSLAENLSKQQELRKKLTANVAHELRTPLTTVGTHLEAMIEGIWEPTPQRLESCYDEVQRVYEIVGDLEHLQKIEADSLNIHKTSFEITGLIDSVIKSHDFEISKNSLTVTRSGNPTGIVADETKIYQVISNLLSNAIKYTPSGGKIDLSTVVKDSMLVLEVSDNGHGIAEHELPLIFEQFYRTDKSRARTTGGSGIGLAVAKSIVAAHGGKIAATSQLNVGTTFTVTLPLAR